MQKDRKNFETSMNQVNHRSRQNAINFPEVVNIDDMATMLDEDLVVSLRTLEEERERAFQSNFDVRPWEEEIAYVRREQQIRRLRREAHTKYLHELELEFANSEHGLPAGDFDNSTYVYAATGGRPRLS